MHTEEKTMLYRELFCHLAPYRNDIYNFNNFFLTERIGYSNSNKYLDSEYPTISEVGTYQIYTNRQKNRTHHV